MDTVRERLARLREIDAGHRRFGAHGHRYAVREPVGSRLLEDVERLVGMRLPEGYREYLTTVGDGGPGPYWGILPLEESVTAVTEVWGAGVLAADSPLTTDIDFGEMLGAPEDWDEHAARLEEDPAYAASWDDLQATYLDEPWGNGRMPICDYGCGDRFHLILRGPRRGTVWVDSLGNATGLYCLEVDFTTWYENWLADALADDPPVNASYSFLKYGRNPRYQPVD